MELQYNRTVCAWFHAGFLEVVIPILIENNQHFDFWRSDYIDYIYFMLIGFAKTESFPPGIENTVNCDFPSESFP